jgi:hypothetical protein
MLLTEHAPRLSCEGKSTHRFPVGGRRRRADTGRDGVRSPGASASPNRGVLAAAVPYPACRSGVSGRGADLICSVVAGASLGGAVAEAVRTIPDAGHNRRICQFQGRHGPSSLQSLRRRNDRRLRKPVTPDRRGRATDLRAKDRVGGVGQLMGSRRSIGSREAVVSAPAQLVVDGTPSRELLFFNNIEER